MKKGLTEMVFILDRSGSMAGLESDTIGGFNGMLNSQRQVEGEAVVTTVLFDDRYELLHDRIPLAGVAPINDKQYYVRGCTAMLDAVGRTIQKIANVQERAAKHPEYLALWEAYRVLSPRLIGLLERLPREDADIVEDYLGLTAEMHRYLLEMACE